MFAKRHALPLLTFCLMAGIASAAQCGDRWKAGDDKLRLFEETFSKNMAEDGAWTNHNIDNRWEVVAEYPEFGHPEIDTHIREWLDQRIAEGVVPAKTTLRAVDKQSSLALEFEYSVYIPSDSAVSVVFNVVHYPDRAARPATRAYALNFSRRTGEELTLDALFRNPDMALALLSVHSKARVDAQLRRRFPNDFTAETGTSLPRHSDILPAGFAPTRDNFACLALEPEGVRVRFQPNQILPFAYGMTEVVVPVVDLLPAGPNQTVWPAAAVASSASPK